MAGAKNRETRSNWGSSLLAVTTTPLHFTLASSLKSGVIERTASSDSNSIKKSYLPRPTYCGSFSNDSNKPGGGCVGTTLNAGKSIKKTEPYRSTGSAPLRVEKRTLARSASFPSSARTTDAAKVAWPHSSTSAFGVNQRRSKPSSRVTRKAVSERFISIATCCSHWSSFHSSSGTTAAGLPAKDRSVKASTMKYAVVDLVIEF